MIRFSDWFQTIKNLYFLTCSFRLYWNCFTLVWVINFNFTSRFKEFPVFGFAAKMGWNEWMSVRDDFDLCSICWTEQKSYFMFSFSLGGLFGSDDWFEIWKELNRNEKPFSLSQWRNALIHYVCVERDWKIDFTHGKIRRERNTDNAENIWKKKTLKSNKIEKRVVCVLREQEIVQNLPLKYSWILSLFCVKMFQFSNLVNVMRFMLSLGNKSK